MGSIFIWWFVVLILGLATFPITFVVLRHLPDKGYFFSKILALMMTGYLTWIFGYVSFNGGTIFFTFLILVGLSALLLWNWTGAYFFDFFKKNIGFFIVVESFFLMAFLVAGAYKMRTYGIVGQEKPMDFTFINGILSSPNMPPHDPWLSGGSISYYYFGYLIMAILCKITMVSAGEAYNLAVALTWALAAVGGFSLGYALTRRYRYAFLSASSLAIFGNMDYWHRAVQSFQIGDLQAPYYNHAVNPNVPAGIAGFFGFLFSPLEHNWDYFQASRIIPVPPADKMINEFPSFSFFLSDLHPHVMAIPFVLLAIALAFNLIKTTTAGVGVLGGRRPWQLFQWGLLMMVFGGLSFMNSWDFPTFLFLFGVCLFLQQWWSNEQVFGTWFKAVATFGIPVVIGSLLLYAPFYFRFQSQAQGIGIGNDRTDLYYLFIIFGLFFTLVIPVLLGKAISTKGEKNQKGRGKKTGEMRCSICDKDGTGSKFCGFCGGDLAPMVDVEIVSLPDDLARSVLTKIGSWLSPESNPLRGWMVLGGLVGLLILGNIPMLKISTILFAALFIVFCLVSLASKTETKEMIFSTLMVLIAFLLILACEVVYLRDLFAGSLYRMNTLFKFYYQAWILFSIASGPFLKWLVDNIWPRWEFWKKAIWLGLALFAILGAIMYPALAFTSRMRGSAADLATMDGSVYYENSFPADYQAAQWISANIKPVSGKVPVILEAWGDSYMTTIETSGGRLATLTGYPTLLGWAWHEVQWRGSGDKAVIRGGDENDTIQHREADIDAIFTSPDLNQTRDLMKKYGVDYVYVGDVERAKYKAHPENLNKFSQLGTVVQLFGGSALYKINS